MAKKAEYAADKYAKHKKYVADKRREDTASGQDVGDAPVVANPERRVAAIGSLRLFCESYFSGTFPLAWSSDHLSVIEKLQASIIGGELFALAMPRASGKTSLLRVAALWALLTGHKQYVVFIVANAGKAKKLIGAIKSTIRYNADLHADFGPELFAFVKLDNQPRRAGGQHQNGRPTNIEWSLNGVAFPSVKESTIGGSVIESYGIESGDIRGSFRTMPDGQTTRRPDMFIVDDPQTKESARSKSQNDMRHEIINGDILGMAGPGVSMTGVVLCTVIEAGDLAERMLDKEQSPAWRGERFQLMRSMPKNMALWDRYAEIKHDCQRRDEPTTPATEFYRNNQAAMDEGAVPSWAARFERHQISAVQYAIDLYQHDPFQFASEYQNQPLVKEASSEALPTPAQIIDRVNRVERGVVPPDSTILTAFVDVQQDALFWTVCGWSQSFTGSVIDYGAWPDQQRRYFTLRDIAQAGRTLSASFPGQGLEAQIYAGLDLLCSQLLDREWLREDGSTARIERCLIDANWGKSTKVVKKFVRQSKWSAIVTPSHGRYVGATSTPFDQYAKKEGEKIGEAWRMPKPIAGEARHIAWDTNYWKSFLFSRLSSGRGAEGAFTFCGSQPSEHRMLGDHLLAENRVQVNAKGREVEEWKIRPGRPDNHYLDCVVGCFVAASMCGCSLTQTAAASTGQRRKIQIPPHLLRKA
jgi:hypothetical protein